MPEAIVRNATTTFHLIEGDQVKQADTLTIGNRKLLTVKGGRSEELVKRVFTEFSNKLDRSGKPFSMSMSQRGICHHDPYGLVVRISSYDLEHLYLNEWFCYCELVHSAPPQTFNSPPSIGGQQQHLRMLDKLPPFVTALICQSRFITRELIDLFPAVD
jgi:hypothetical protein